ncbi:hypothetical protein MRB53_037597 [Persea americana]|nr:hypothetical protein MRB53_037597 [Persea americana]
MDTAIPAAYANATVENAPHAPFTNSTATLSREEKQRKIRRSRKPKTTLAALCQWVVEHQIALIHISLPSARERTSTFFQLSYFDSKSGKYLRGLDDLNFVALWVVIFIGLRVAKRSTMCSLQLPGSAASRTARRRSASQSRELWRDFPDPLMSSTFKLYYLVQFAFYLQLIFVLHIEEHRKDHWQMFAHHMVTCALLVTSYGYYQQSQRCSSTPAGRHSATSSSAFSCSSGSSLVTSPTPLSASPSGATSPASSPTAATLASPVRPSSAQTPAPTSSGNSYSRFRDPGGVVCYNPRIRFSFLALLGILQAITIFWFVLIVRIVYMVITGRGADDVRSDDEGEAEEDAEEFEEEEKTVEAIEAFRSPVQKNDVEDHAGHKISSVAQKPIEESVGVDELNLRQRRSTRASSSRRATKGINIGGHSDRKELLGRIGCDKPS